MRNLIEFSSWQGLLSTLLGLVLVTVGGAVGNLQHSQVDRGYGM